MRDILAEVMEEEGYCTLRASNGREALEALEQAKRAELPCVILLDMMMPVLDGREFRAVQRQDTALADIPVVLLSAHIDGDKAAAELAAAQFLRKPVDVDALLQIVDHYC